MFRLDADKPVEFCDGLRRRDFLHAGSLSFLGLGLTQFFGLKAQGAVRNQDRNCIMLFLVGGPSQLDTWDPKPKAPEEVRGPFSVIKTNVPGIRSEKYLRVSETSAPAETEMTPARPPDRVQKGSPLLANQPPVKPPAKPTRRCSKNLSAANGSRTRSLRPRSERERLPSN